MTPDLPDLHGTELHEAALAEIFSGIGGPPGAPHDQPAEVLALVVGVYREVSRHFGLPELVRAEPGGLEFKDEPVVSIEATSEADGLLKTALALWRRIYASRDRCYLRALS